MTYTRSLLTAAMVAAPLSVIGFGAQAADVVKTIQNQQQFSTLAKALKSAGITDSLTGSGPYTVFAPTDDAFAQLPPGTMDYLMQQGNQDQLKKLLQYHVVKGKELQADQMIGKEAKVDTVEGGKLSIDGTGRMVLVVPTGLIATQVGDQIIYRREVAAMSAPAVEIAPAAGQTGQQGSQQAQSGSSSGSNGQQQAQSGGSSTSSNQQQASNSGSSQQQSGSNASGSNQQQASAGDQGSTEQRQASASDQGADQQARTEVTEQSNMPASKHQEEVLKQHPQTEQQQTMATTEGAMPSTKHQREVLRGQQPGEQQNGQQASNQQGGNGQQMATPESGQDQGALREATVIGGPIKADNGVIYAVDGVLVPQSILSQVESQGQQGQGQNQQNNQQGQSQPNKS